ncbi:MAG: tetratricopeptide repeat protein [Bacteroidia bacterium]|nr:tetratricopeptide repeat protein [Bacteroidia bacterium]
MKLKILVSALTFLVLLGSRVCVFGQEDEEIREFVSWTSAEINPEVPCADQVDHLFVDLGEFSPSEKEDLLDLLSGCENQPNGVYVFVSRKLFEANEALQRDNFFLAWEYFHLGLARLEELAPDSPVREYFLLGVATGYVRTRAPHHAIRYLHQALKVNEKRKKKIPLNLLHVYSKMAVCHNQMQNQDSSFYYCRKAVEYCSEYPSTIWYASSLNNLGWRFEEAGNLDSAQYYYQHALGAIKDYMVEEPLYTAILDNLGNIHQKKKEWDQAYEQFNLTYQWALKLDAPPRLVWAGGKCILILLRDPKPSLAQIAEARQIMASLDSVLQLYPRRTFTQRLEYWYQARIRLDLINQDNEAAWEDMRAFRAYNDSVANTLSNKRLKALELFLVKTSDRFNDELNYADLEAEKSRQTLRFTLILGGLLLALLILVGWSLRNKVQFQRTELQVKDFREKINQLELDNSSLKKKELEQELKLKNRDVTDLALEMQLRSKAKKDLILQLDDILKSASPNMQLRRLINDLRRQAGDEQISELKHTHPDQVNNNFKERLAEKYPDLTRAEKEFCELFLLDIPIKEIANLRKISAQSVRMAKYRLRKKLNLEAEEDLTQFLKEL